VAAHVAQVVQDFRSDAAALPRGADDRHDARLEQRTQRLARRADHR
jgi:hypothetical protein